MSPGSARWLLPLGAATSVLATILLAEVAVGHGGQRTGVVGPDQASLRVPMPAPERVDSVPDGPPRITGYQTAGRALTVYYRLSPRSDCSREVRPPSVRQDADAVAVRLLRTPTGRPDERCADQRLNGSVTIRLQRPLAGRMLQDASYRDVLVTPYHAAP